MRLKLRLGDILVQSKIITEEQLNHALAIHRSSGQKLGTVLTGLGLITEVQLFTVLEQQYGIPYVDINTVYIDSMVPKLINESLATKHTLIPIALDKSVLTVAMVDPLDVIARDDIRISTGYEVAPVISSKVDILKAINQYYDVSETAAKAVEDFKSQIGVVEEIKEEEDADVTNAPMVRLVNSIISQAVRSKASDIHIEPFERNVRIRFRIDGDLREVMSPEKSTHGALVTRIKIMGKMNISERRVPQDGRVETVIEGIPVDMRISILPTVYGEKVVIRLLDRSSLVLRKSDLGFTEHNLRRIEKILKVPEGIFLVTGPTGSGKTTTLYSLLKEVNTIDKNIITVEDPVEYRLEGINQVQVNNKAGLTFAEGLRSILRQDPDVVMVGEIRDVETAEIAVRAAITGHVVFSTIHTNDTVSTISRLTDMGIPPYLLGSSIIGVVAQRLVKKVCLKCKAPYDASVEEKHFLNLDADAAVTLYRGAGCNNCNHTGYLGRAPIHEVLMMDASIKALVAQNKSENEIFKVAKEKGLVSLQQTCAELVLMGITSIDEMIRMTFKIEE